MGAPPYSQALSILCIDDDHLYALAIRRQVLEAVGYRVLVAASAYEALRLLLKNRVDLVLMEQGMTATVKGPSLASTLRRMRPRLAIVIYSADWEERPEETRFADLFLSKLAPTDELLETVERLLMKRPLQAGAA